MTDMGHMRTSSPPTDALVNEFMTLNRRRLFGSPPLGVDDLDRWQDLRQTLEHRLGNRLDGLLSVVERRAHFRFPTHLEVRFESGEDLRSACLENLSEGGMFIASERPLAAGTPLQLSISVPSGKVRISGRAWPGCAPCRAAAGPRAWASASRISPTSSVTGSPARCS